MSDYIKREDACERLWKKLRGLSDVIPMGKDAAGVAVRIIEDLPIADVEPVRHAKWSHDYIKDGMEYSDWFNLHCSVCGQMQFSTFGKWNYCPYCGAKMDEEEQEHDNADKS